MAFNTLIRAFRPDISDDECIALAMLDGATFFTMNGSWFVHKQGEREPIPDGCAGLTRGDACRRYVKRHNLLR